MNHAPKMNFLYKIGFILMLVCVALFTAAIIFLLVVENTTAGVILSVVGAALCLLAIILTMFSKPKPPKPKAEDFSWDDDKNLTENAGDDIIELDKGE